MTGVGAGAGAGAGGHVCTHELGCREQSISIHLHITQVAPVHNLAEEMRNTVLVTLMCLGRPMSLVNIKALTKPSFSTTHTSTSIHSSMQACVFVVCILHLNVRFNIMF